MGTWVENTPENHKMAGEKDPDACHVTLMRIPHLKQIKVFIWPLGYDSPDEAPASVVISFDAGAQDRDAFIKAVGAIGSGIVDKDFITGVVAQLVDAFGAEVGLTNTDDGIVRETAGG